MYVCLCYAVNERRIREAVREGDRSFEAVQRRTGLGLGCGSCGQEGRDAVARAVLEEVSARTGRPQASAVAQSPALRPDNLSSLPA